MSIKKCFVSRWNNGLLMEVDFSQLEVVALAILSGDEVLKNDILSGLDMHRKRAAELFGKPEKDVSDEERRIAKALSFQLQYGAGYKSMAEKNGVSEAISKAFINNYYSRYPKVKAWQDGIIEEVKGSRKKTNMHTTKGAPKGEGSHISPTGRVYKFYEYDNNFGKFGGTSFSPTEMKNYPVQGFATGDVMALYRGRVYRRLISEGRQANIVLINTVHDSVMLDVPSFGDVQWAYWMMKEEANRLPELIKDLWGMKIDLPFNVECKYGPTWADMEKLEI